MRTLCAILVFSIAGCGTFDQPIDRAGLRAEEAVRLAGEEMRKTTTEAIQATGAEARAILGDAREEAQKLLQSATTEARAIVSEAMSDAREVARDVGQEAKETIQLARAESQVLLADAQDRMEHIIQDGIDKAGDRLDQSIDHLGDRTEDAVALLSGEIHSAVDRAGDRGEKIVERTEAAASKARADAEGFLDYLKEWWMAVVGVLANAITGWLMLRSRLKAKRAEKTTATVVQAVEMTGATPVKVMVHEALKQDKDRAHLEALIAKLANEGKGGNHGR